MSEALQELGGIIALKQADAVVSATVAFGELTLVANLAHLEALVEFLRTANTKNASVAGKAQ